VATVSRKVCDTCGSEKDVEELVISYKFEAGKPWSVDLCGRCYTTRFSDLMDKSRPVKRANLRPQYRIKETVLRPEQL
jgi:hypothetical protein